MLASLASPSRSGPSGRAVLAVASMRSAASRRLPCSQNSKGGTNPPRCKARPLYPGAAHNPLTFPLPPERGHPATPRKGRRLPNPCASCHSAASRSLPTPKTKFIRNDRFARSVKFCCQACRYVLLHCPLGRRLLVPTLYGIWGSRSVSPGNLRRSEENDFSLGKKNLWG